MTPERLTEAAIRLARYDPVVARAIQVRAAQDQSARPTTATPELNQVGHILVSLLAGPKLAVEIAHDTGLSSRQVSSAFGNMASLIRHAKKGPQRSWYWTLTEAGRQLAVSSPPSTTRARAPGPGKPA